MQIVLMAGIFERRPKANTIPSGNAKAIPNVESMSVSGKPPHRLFSTWVKPKTPPHINTAAPVKAINQNTKSDRFQNRRIPLKMITPSNNKVASNGRHCSS